MSAGMPELGSKISLISKADIRYEGRLFTVDPAECTIALANVRSYGTEDRETQFPISPQNQIYDYILFRGSDIKDIRVVNNVPTMPNDPAIMQMQLPAQQIMGAGPAGFQPQQFPVPVMGHIGAQMGQFGSAYNPMAGLGGLGGAIGGLAPGSNMSGLHKTKQTTSVLDLIGGGSRSTTPLSLHSRKSPTADMGVQHQQNRNSNQQYHANNQNRGWNQNNRGQNNQNNLVGHNGAPGTNMRGQRPRGRGPMNQGGYRQAVHQQNSKGARPKSTIKFESDYDFEQANNKFEELRLELAKLKVGEDAKPEQLNGEADKKDDSGNETGAGEHEQEDDEVTVGYDKTKSFFDNISCEAANDRTKGKNRTDWRHERKINSETFGVSARRGGFFNYRGRGGGYFNRNNQNNQMQGGGGGGGYRQNNGGYRGQNNQGFRGRNYNNRSYQHQSSATGIPVQPTTNKQQEQPPVGSANAGAVDAVSLPAPVAAN